MLWIFLLHTGKYIHTYIHTGNTFMCIRLIWVNLCIWYLISLTFAKYLANTDLNKLINKPSLLLPPRLVFHSIMRHANLFGAAVWNVCCNNRNIASGLQTLTCASEFFSDDIFYFCLCRWTGTTVWKLQHYAKKRERPLVLYNVVLNIVDQHLQHEQQTAKKGAFQHF